MKNGCYYKKAEWTKLPHDYLQVLSGGGKCGARAWMGRFACRAHGNPVWGVRQPGHAALGRWMPTGWTTALGAPFKASFWEDRDGLDFIAESKARKCLGDEAYFQKAGLLDWIALVLGDTTKGSRVSLDNIWPALAIAQRRRLSSMEMERKPIDNGHCEVLSRITEVKERPIPKEQITVGEDGSVIVPISCRSSANGHTEFMKSFIDDGMQCFARPKPDCWDITFSLPVNKLPEKKAYKMSLSFVAVHIGNVLPFNVTVTDATGGNEREYELPYEMKWDNLGMWQATEPIEVLLGGEDEILTLTRKEKKHPCAMKTILLTPC